MQSCQANLLRQDRAHGRRVLPQTESESEPEAGSVWWLSTVLARGRRQTPVHRGYNIDLWGGLRMKTLVGVAWWSSSQLLVKSWGDGRRNPRVKLYIAGAAASRAFLSARNHQQLGFSSVANHRTKSCKRCCFSLSLFPLLSIPVYRCAVVVPSFRRIANRDARKCCLPPQPHSDVKSFAIKSRDVGF